MKTLFLSIVSFVLFVVYPIIQVRSADFNAGLITISDPWARGSFTKARSAAAYMMLKNNSEELDQLIGFKSSVAKKVELHQTQYIDGIMKMSVVKTLNIPAGSLTIFKPGSRHVMFFGLGMPLKEGSSFPLTLEFAKAGKVKIMVRVLKFFAFGNKKRNVYKY